MNTKLTLAILRTVGVFMAVSGFFLVGFYAMIPSGIAREVFGGVTVGLMVLGAGFLVWIELKLKWDLRFFAVS